MTGKVYFIECAGRIKIGHTRDIRDRLKGLSTGAPQELNVLATIDGSTHLEKAVHRLARAHREKGEWFKDCEEIRALMADLMTRGPAAIGFVEPARVTPLKKRDIQPNLFITPLRPAYKRIDACMDRYVGEGVSENRRREQELDLPVGSLINRTFVGYYSVLRAALAFRLIDHTLDCMSGLLDLLNDTLADDIPMDQRDLVPRAERFVVRLETGLHRLFENPDIEINDVSGYEGASFPSRAPELPA